MRPNIHFRKPNSKDGLAVHQLIAQCPPLDTNSLYCNLLQCSHFQATCVIAEKDQAVCGFASAYLIPDRPDTLFIWQVAVAETARGRGLGKQMIQHILQRPYAQPIHHLETTITESNSASWKLFTRLAEDCHAPIQSNVLFERDIHFNGGHDSEILVHIGPLNSQPSTPSNP